MMRCVAWMLAIMTLCASCGKTDAPAPISVAVRFTNGMDHCIEVWIEESYVGDVPSRSSALFETIGNRQAGLGITAIGRDRGGYRLAATRLSLDEDAPMLVVVGSPRALHHFVPSDAAAGDRPLHADLHAARWVSLSRQGAGEPIRHADSLIGTQWNGEEVRGIEMFVSHGTRASFVNSMAMTFVRIPAGTSVGADRGEGVLTIITRDYFIAKTEVTVAQWEAAMGGDLALQSTVGELPRDSITWFMAADFCDRLSCENFAYGLPTEAQWEYACRGGLSEPFSPSGVRIDRIMWSNSNSGGRAHGVGGLMPNGYGLYDMHGNLREWCSDWFHPQQPPRGVDPAGPKEPFVVENSYTFSSPQRSRRGGSFDYYPSSGASGARDACPPDSALTNTGFRPIVTIDGLDDSGGGKRSLRLSPRALPR